MYTNEENEPQCLQRRRRRTHSPEFKSELVMQCQQVGVSVAAVAMDHGINPNLLRRWITEHERLGRHAALQNISMQRDIAAQFIALPLSRAQPPELHTQIEQPIVIELQRNGLSVSVRWPMGQAQQCAAWLRDVMR